MNKEQLLGSISFLFQTVNPVGLRLYFVIKDGEDTILKLANIEPSVELTLKNQFVACIKELLIDNLDLDVIELSTADNRKNVVYNYDLEEIPQGLSVLGTVLNVQEQIPFNFNTDDLVNIKAFVILMGNEENQISIYKKHFPFNYLRRSKTLYIFPLGNIFEKFNHDFLNINGSFDFIQVGNDLIVIKLTVLENFFGYDKIIKEKATKNIQLIGNRGLLVDVAPLISLISDLKFAKKLVRLKQDSPVLRTPVSLVIEFIRNHPSLSKRIKFNIEETKIALQTKISLELFIKLLNDDFLKSELTNLNYDSQSKDSLILDEPAILVIPVLEYNQ